MKLEIRAHLGTAADSCNAVVLKLRIPRCGDTAGAGQVGLEICAGLKAIHQLQVIHRDLKVYTLTPNPPHPEPLT